MRLWPVAINRHIPRGARYPQHHTIQVSRALNLAAQARPAAGGARCGGQGRRAGTVSPSCACCACPWGPRSPGIKSRFCGNDRSVGIYLSRESTRGPEASRLGFEAAKRASKWGGRGAHCRARWPNAAPRRAAPLRLLVVAGAGDSEHNAVHVGRNLELAAQPGSAGAGAGRAGGGGRGPVGEPRLGRGRGRSGGGDRRAHPQGLARRRAPFCPRQKPARPGGILGRREKERRQQG